MSELFYKKNNVIQMDSYGNIYYFNDFNEIITIFYYLINFLPYFLKYYLGFKIFCDIFKIKIEKYIT